MSGIRVAFSTLACPAWPLARVLEAAAAFGYDGIELRLLDGEVIDPHRHAAAVRRAVAACRDRGLEVCALDTSCRLNATLPAERAALAADLPAWIALARATDVPLVRLFGGATSPEAEQEPSDAAETRVAAALAWAAPLAAAAGVTLLVETHDAFSSARRLARVLAAVPSPAVGALWDSHHPYRMGEGNDEVATQLGARLRHVHLKDARRVRSGGDEWQLVPLGEGEVPVRDQLAALQQLGYGGWLSLEWEKKWHPELAEPEETLPTQLAWLRSTLASLEETV